MNPRTNVRTARSRVFLPWRVLCLALCLAPSAVMAQETTPEPLHEAREIYEQVRAEVAGAGDLTAGGYAELTRRMDRVRLTASRCARETEGLLARQERLETTLVPRHEGATSGPFPDGEGTAAPASVRFKEVQAKLATQRADLEARLLECRLLEIDSDELAAELIRRGQQASLSTLFEREPHVVEVLHRNLVNLGEWPAAGQALVRLLSGSEELGAGPFTVLVAVTLFALAAGVAWRRRPLAFGDMPDELPFTTNLLIAFRVVTHAYAVPLFVLVAVSACSLVLIVVASVPWSAIWQAPVALLLLLLAMGVRTLLDPPAPARSLLKVPEGKGRTLSRLLQTLSFLVLVALLLGEARGLDSFDRDKQLLLGDIYVLLLAINVLALIDVATRGDLRGAERLFKRLLPTFVMVLVVVAMWLGYVELARLLFLGTLGTAIALLGVLLLARLVDDLQDGLDQGHYAWQRGLRHALGLTDGDPVPGLGWLLLVLQITLWGIFLLMLLRLWGVPAQTVEHLVQLLVSGFEIGSLTIVPSRILWAVLTLLLLVMVVRWVRSQLEKRWLLRTRMERGAREAVATSFGYAGIAAVAMLSLAMAGIDFSNLAIIAGALSVGIGFGLQNVVNNFISGLIMLFERPVKTGDWIVVGNTEGYVRRISIRTTTIETFDRSEVIVPNSELISNQVTNWMHNHNFGRFKVPVGVAYGSDTERVRQVLLEAARAHPQVVTNDSGWPDPWVLFLGFGDSALNFELRGIVYNADNRLGVISDLNFAVDRAFREHGIEIPFPQRVVHMAEASGASDEKPPTKPDETPR